MTTLQHRARTGKIARLPRHIRTELNLRLESGEPGSKLVAWLNALPEVQAILAEQFRGQPIRQQNLSRWRLGGFQEWLLDQNAKDAASRYPDEASEFPEPDPQGRSSLIESLSHWLALRYALATRHLADQQGPDAWRLLRQFGRDITDMRRNDIASRRLALQRQSEALKVAKKMQSLTPLVVTQILNPPKPQKPLEGIFDPELAPGPELRRTPKRIDQNALDGPKKTNSTTEKFPPYPA